MSGDVPVEMSDSPYRELERSLATLIRSSRSTLRSAALALDESIDPASYTLLVYLQKRPRISMSTIAEAQCVGRGTMSRQIARLEKLGHVQRRLDPDDSRVQLVELTPRTAQRISEVRQTFALRLREALSTWSSADVTQLTELLTQFVDSFDEAHSLVPLPSESE